MGFNAITIRAIHILRTICSGYLVSYYHFVVIWMFDPHGDSCPFLTRGFAACQIYLFTRSLCARSCMKLNSVVI